MTRFKRRKGGIQRVASGNDQRLSEILFEDHPDAILITDSNGLIVRANKGCGVLMGGLAVEMQGRPIFQMFHADDRHLVRQALSNASREWKAPCLHKVRLAGAANSDCRIVLLTAKEVQGDNVTSAILVIRLTDLSAQMALDAERMTAQRLQTVGTLAGGIAHDFNNLLTVVLGASEEILAHTEADPSILGEAINIHDSARRSAELVSQLLAFGRQQVLPPRLVAVNAAIAGVADLIRSLLGKTIQLACEVEEPPGLIRIDPTQFSRVLINLAVNARNAMPKGGTLTLKASGKTLYAPLATDGETIPAGRYVVVDVVDTGIGIPPDILPRIFDPFFTTRADQGGSGLGLATVYGIVHQSGGLLHVMSSPGEGACFRLYFPRAEDEAIVEPIPPAEARPDRQGAPFGGLILLVEDEEGLRRLTERALRRAGWRVLAAETAEAALAMLPSSDGGADARLAAVISDVVMPGMAGVDLVAAIRDICPNLPAILVSGYAQEPLRRDVIASGITFLPKPYEMASLLTALHDVMRSSAGSQGGSADQTDPVD